MQRSEPAAPSILIHTITVHFIGNPREEQAAAKSVLINFRKNYFFQIFNYGKTKGNSIPSISLNL